MDFFRYYKARIGSENKRYAMIHWLILVMMAVVLLWTVVSCIIHRRPETVALIEEEDFYQENGTQSADGGCYIDENFSTDPVLFIKLGEMQVEEGTYRITVCYENTDTNAVVYLTDTPERYDRLIVQDKECYLRRGRNLETFEFCVKDTKADLNVRVFFLGTGELKVHSFTFEKTRESYTNRLWNVLLLILVVIGGYYCAYVGNVRSKKERFVFLFLIGTIIVASYPLFVDFLYRGHDLGFHMIRIEGLKSAILSGQIPARVQPLWYSGAGYATSLYYCDMPIIFPALLRIMGVPAQTAYQMFLILINIMTCLITYYSLSRMSRDRLACLVGTFLYTNSIYRLNNLYNRAAIGEVCAMIFLPLVLYGMWLILHTDTRSEKKISIFPLAVGMTGVILSHVLTTEMIGVLLLFSCIICYKKILKEKRYLYVIRAAVLTVLLSAWFIIPFISQFSKMAGGNFATADVDSTGTFLAQIFMTFPTDRGKVLDAIDGIQGKMITSVGLPVLLAVFFVIIVVYSTGCYKNKQWKDIGLILLLGILTLIFSSHLFPWEFIAERFSAYHMSFISSMIGSIQFLWRWVGVATVLLSVVAALGLDRISGILNRIRYETAIAVILAIGVISACYYNDTFMSVSSEVRAYFEADALVLRLDANGDGMYLPAGSDVDVFWRGMPDPYAVSGSKVSVTHRKGQTMTLEISDQADGIDNAEAMDAVILPYVYYDGYVAKDNATGKKYETYCTADYAVGVRIPSGYNGTITVRYQGKWYWRIAEAVSLATFVYVLWKVRRCKKAQKIVMNN